MKTFKATYFSGKSKIFKAADYAEAVLIAHRLNHKSCVADVEEIA